MYEVVEVLYCSNKSNLQIITLNIYTGCESVFITNALHYGVTVTLSHPVFFEIIDSFAIVEPNKSSFRGQINETDNLKNSHVFLLDSLY